MLGLLVVLAFFMRFFSFFPAVMDHDESTYIVIADAIRSGDLFMRDVIDVKPPGIFWLFAIFQSVFGSSILMIRIMCTIWVALTAWVLYLVYRAWFPDKELRDRNPAPAAAALIYLFVTSVYTYYGISPNTELFFNLFTITALYLMIRHPGFAGYGLAGVLLGMGFMIKYIVLADGVAFGLFFLWQNIREKRAWTSWLGWSVALGAGFLLPFVVTWLWAWSHQLQEEFYFFAFELPSQYRIDFAMSHVGNFLINGLGRYLPVTVWFVFCLWHWKAVGRPFQILGLLWTLFVMLVILLPGKFFAHYIIHFFLPFCLISASFFDRRRQPGPILGWMRNPKLGYVILGLILLANLVYQKKDYFDKKKTVREVAAYLNERLEPDDRIYTGDYHQILYHLTGTSSPTSYVHRSLLWDIENVEALELHQEDEFVKILACRPRFILLEEKPRDRKVLTDLMEGRYRPVKKFDDIVTVYERM